MIVAIIIAVMFTVNVIVIVVEKHLCRHKWRYVKNIYIHDHDDADSMPVEVNILCQCEKCGKFREFKGGG